MTADRLFAPVAAADQAKALLTYAASDRFFFTPYNDESHRVLNDRDSATAMYAAQAATAHALLAIHADLTRIGDCLQAAARTPIVLHELAEQVSDLASEVLGCNEATTVAAMDVAAAIRETGEIVDSAMFGVVDVMDRPRPWQWRRRRALRKAEKQDLANLDAYLVEGAGS